MEPQTLINLMGGGVCVLVGWILHNIWDEIKAQRSATSNLTGRVHNVEVLVAGQYAKRDELDQHMTRVYNELRLISNKLDGKVDK